MTICTIELNDSDIRVANGIEIVLRSPGYAFINEDKIELGAAAASQARLQPRAVHNRYWKNLNQDPLQYPGSRARHNADLAFAQLLAIHEQAGKPEEVIFAVPGTFSNEQLALLLGLVEASPFKAIGLVDTAVAAITPVAGKGSYVHIDMHLHQTILTRINVARQVTRTSVQLIEGTGITSIFDATAHLIADQFIKESRFDPQHHPETEQALYDQIPTCLNSLQNRSEVSLEIQYQQTQHQAKLTSEMLMQVLLPLYQKIVGALDTSETCMISHQLGLLPGLKKELGDVQVLAPDTLFKTCVHQTSEIQSAGAALNYVVSLAASDDPVIIETQSQSKNTAQPDDSGVPAITHILLGHNARALSDSELYLSATGLISTNAVDNSHCSIKLQNGSVELHADGNLVVFVNGQQIQQSKELNAGDIISFTGSKTEYTLIHVEA